MPSNKYKMPRVFRHRLRTSSCVLAATVTGALILSCPAYAQKYAGQARVANVTALSLLGVDVLNTGSIPSIGGILNTGNLPVNIAVGIPPITTATVLNASTSFASTTGANGSVTSTSGISAVSLLSLEALGATILAPTVTVGAISSFAYADANGTQGYTQIADLRVGTQVVNVATFAVNGQLYAAPNQTLEVLGVRLTINEQTIDSNGKLTVNALRVQASPVGIGAADIALGTTQAGFAAAVVPEASTMTLLGTGAMGMVGVIACKRKH